MYSRFLFDVKSRMHYIIYAVAHRNGFDTDRSATDWNILREWKEITGQFFQSQFLLQLETANFCFFFHTFHDTKRRNRHKFWKFTQLRYPFANLNCVCMKQLLTWNLIHAFTHNSNNNNRKIKRNKSIDVFTLSLSIFVSTVFFLSQ